jgi:hypothetical protein
MNGRQDLWDDLDKLTPETLTALLRRHFAAPEGALGLRERQIARAAVRLSVALEKVEQDLADLRAQGSGALAIR